MSDTGTEGVDVALTGSAWALSVRSAPTRQPSAHPAAATNLVGRSAELERLAETFELAAGGRAMGMLIAGDAGVGKSRIVEEFCDRVRLRGALVATGLCVPSDNAVPYAPVMGVLRELGRHLGHPPRAARLLEAMGGYLDAVDLDEPARPPGDEPGERQDAAGPPAGLFAKTVFFETVLHDVATLAERSPVLLVFEDLHWSDSASSELFDFLIRNLGDARVLTVGTYRDEELGAQHPLTPWLAELFRHSRVGKLSVGPLDHAEVAVLVTNSLGRRPAPALLESVWTRSLGNPFFAEELLAEGDPAVLPNAVKAVVEHRVRQLPEPTQRLLELAATAGMGASHQLLEAAGDLTADVLDGALASAIDKKILVVDEPGTGYRFRHALLREAVYERLLPAQRRRLHRSIAVVLAAARSTSEPGGPGPEIVELAWHWWAAGEWTQALPASLQAADATIAALAFREADTFLQRALIADTRVPEATLAAGLSRAQLLEQAADIAYLAGANARAVELAQQAVSAIDAGREPVAAARCQTLLGRNLWGVGDSPAAFEAYRTALALLPDDTPSVERARLLAEEARGFMLLSQFGAGVTRAREALDAARAAGSRQVEGHALNTLGCCLGAAGSEDEGIALVQQSLEIAEELANPEDMNRAYSNLSHLRLEIGCLEEAASMMFDSVAVGEDLWGCRLNGATGNAVEAMVRLGRYAEAEGVLALLGSQALGVCAPAPWTLPSPMLIRRGDFDDAASAISYALDMTARLGDVQQAATSHALAGELALERGRPDEAASAFEQARVLVARSDDEILLPELCMWSARAIADLQASAPVARGIGIADGRQSADQVVAAAADIVDRRERSGAVATPRQRAGLAQTAAERSRLDGSDAQLWDRAAQLWADAHEAYPEAYCRWREAEAVLEARGARSRATAALDAAQRIAQRLEARPLLGRIAQLAQRGRLQLSAGNGNEPTPALQAAQALGLTPREVEVLGLLAEGSSDREIAERLFISKKTVSVHVSNVLRKLAVSGRFEAARIGQAHGLGEPASPVPTPSRAFD